MDCLALSRWKRHYRRTAHCPIMDEMILALASGDLGGMCACDLRNGGTVMTFKNCSSDSAGSICTIGGSSSFSGMGVSSDYVAVAISKKPVIHIYAWGKPQPLMQCHVQEIITALASDLPGQVLVGGSRSGRMFCWDICSGALLAMWQGHFKSITRIQVTKCGYFVVTVSDDAYVKVWDLPLILDVHCENSSGKPIPPFRSLSPHTLPISDMKVLGSHATIRVVLCSFDQSVVVYDVYSDTICLKVTFSMSLMAITSTPNEDMLFVGASSGKIFIIDLTERAITLSASHAVISKVGHAFSRNNCLDGQMSLDGHSSSITALSSSQDNKTLVSVSSDGSMRVWDVTTRQCLRESFPFKKNSLSNVSGLSTRCDHNRF